MPPMLVGSRSTSCQRSRSTTIASSQTPSATTSDSSATERDLAPRHRSVVSCNSIPPPLEVCDTMDTNPESALTSARQALDRVSEHNRSSIDRWLEMLSREQKTDLLFELETWVKCFDRFFRVK